jgi:hypothetical protein
MSRLRFRILGAFILVVVAEELAFTLFPVSEHPWIIVVAVLAGVAVAWALSSSLLTSLGTIRKAADAVAAGDPIRLLRTRSRSWRIR